VRVRKAKTTTPKKATGCALQWGLTREGEEGRQQSGGIFRVFTALQWGLTREGEEGGKYSHWCRC